MPAYRLLWLGMLPATMAWQMGVVAAPYAAFQLEGSATVLGVVSVATGLPMLLLSLAGGVAADRWPRRRVLIATQSTLGLASAALALVTLAGRLQIWHLLAFGAAQGVAFSFNMPARQAYIADVVERSMLRNAVALNNAGINFCRIAGPALAGGLLSVPSIGVGGVFLGMAIAYGIVLLSVIRLPDDNSTARADGETGGGRKAGGWSQMVEGLRYVWSATVIRALLGMALLAAVVGMPFQSILPLFAERVFEVGAAGLGTLMAATGVGALSGSLLVAGLRGGPRPVMLQLGLGVAFGLGLVGFALAPVFPLAVASLVVVGFASSGYNSVNNTLIVGNADPRFYGRVMSVYLLTFAAMPFGALPMAWLADQVGGRATIAAAGLVIAAAVAGIGLLYPPYRRIK